MNTADKAKLAKALRCPKCGAQPHMSCQRYTRTALTFLRHPHKERMEAVSEETSDA